MTRFAISEGDRFGLLNVDGEQVSVWQVIYRHRMPSGGVRLVIFKVDTSEDIIEISEGDLRDPTRFRRHGGTWPLESGRP